MERDLKRRRFGEGDSQLVLNIPCAPLKVQLAQLNKGPIDLKNQQIIQRNLPTVGPTELLNGPQTENPSI